MKCPDANAVQSFVEDVERLGPGARAIADHVASCRKCRALVLVLVDERDASDGPQVAAEPSGTD